MVFKTLAVSIYSSMDLFSIHSSMSCLSKVSFPTRHDSRENLVQKPQPQEYKTTSCGWLNRTSLFSGKSLGTLVLKTL